VREHTKDEYYAGKGCTCNAWGEHECCCDADWTDPRIYELLKALETVEWVDRLSSDMHTVERVCAWCGGLSVFVGHKDDCPRQAAIAKARGIKP
jgi:hypothetical protein